MESLRKEINTMHTPVILGMGNEINGDDGAGNYIAQELSSKLKHFSVMDAGTQPDNFTKKIAEGNPSHVIFVDAATIEGPGGSLSPIPLEDIDNICFHTHYVPLKYVIQRIREKCDCKFLIIGIKPVSTEPGNSLTEPVRAAADKLIAAFVELDRAIENNG